MGVAAARQAPAAARRAVRHQRLDGAPLAAAAAVRPGLSGSAVQAEAFVFGTHLTRVTPAAARPRPRPRAGQGLRGRERLGRRHAHRRVAAPVQPEVGAAGAALGAVVVVVSDGWDRGDPSLVAEEMARLQRSCHRLIWLNPLAGAPGYQPLAGGMQAAYPFIDDFLPAGTVANLERLGQILAGNSPSGRPIAGRPIDGGRATPADRGGSRARRPARGCGCRHGPGARGEGWAGPAGSRTARALGRPDARRTTGFSDPTRPTPLAPDPQPSAPRRLSGRTT